MKNRAAIVLIVMLGVTGGLVYMTTHTVANHLLGHHSISPIFSCSHIGSMHTVIIEQGIAIPDHTSAKLCDKLKIVNGDDGIRLMAFGVHENHQAYNGVVENALDQGQSLTVTLNQQGTYKFHDHLDDQAHGTFTVK